MGQIGMAVRDNWQGEGMGTMVNFAFRDGQFVDVYLMARLREQEGSD